MITKPRGTLDILPAEMRLWHKVEQTARRVAAQYGFEEIRFPTFEATELFARGVGDTTDVVQKEMYTFSDRDGRSLTLRPEGTACVVRSLIENGMCSDTMPLKLYYLTNFFRYEKPQAGRSREFYQFGVEMFGAPSAGADAEIISLADRVIRGAGVNNARLYINSIGCPECRKGYHAALKAYFASRKDQLCNTCRGRLETNPMRILDCKSPICAEIAADAPKTIDFLCEDCSDHFEQLKKHLDAMGMQYEINPRIVRGLDYYTKTVFEFVSDAIGAQSTICGGGRYDGLVQSVGGPKLCGIGFGMGITRLLLTMKACGVEEMTRPAPLLYVAPMGAQAAVKANGLISALRDHGVYAECDIVGRSLKAQMKYADKIGAHYTLILGDSELETGLAQLKNMKDSTQSEVRWSDTDGLLAAIGAAEV